MSQNELDLTRILHHVTQPLNPQVPVPYLLVLAGDQVGRVIRLEPGKAKEVGRMASCDIHLDDTNLSRRHAVLSTSDEGETTLVDLQSTNGSRVNGKKITKATLKDGDRISLGNVVLRFSLKDDFEYLFQKKLFQKATRDGLTNLYNRSYFLDSLKRELSYHQRLHLPLSLLIFDLDDFKGINDHFGHLAGDHALIHFCQTVEHSLRTEDLFARFGGEEFMALFRGTNESQAITIAEKLREKVAQTLLTFPDGKPIAKMTVTIGIATWEPGAPLNTQEMIETLIKTADHCLYYGKRHGKNQVVAPSLLPE